MARLTLRARGEQTPCRCPAGPQLLMRARMIAAPSSPIANKKDDAAQRARVLWWTCSGPSAQEGHPAAVSRICTAPFPFQSSGHGSSLGAELWTGFFLSSSFSPSGRCGTTEEKRASDAGATLRAQQRDVGQLHSLLTGAAQPCSTSLHLASFH